MVNYKFSLIFKECLVLKEIGFEKIFGLYIFLCNFFNGFFVFLCSLFFFFTIDIY